MLKQFFSLKFFRFKELNRKLRDWLITLDVNDVKDIYDEKCSEDVLKDPEVWVRNTLSGPEKRIILVCSKLAYECLVCVKRGISSPKFVETDQVLVCLISNFFINKMSLANKWMRKKNTLFL